MPSDQLKQTLLDLHARLAAGEHLDPELQGLLRLLETDIRQRLAQDAPAHQAEVPGTPQAMPGPVQSTPVRQDALSTQATAPTTPAAGQSAHLTHAGDAAPGGLTERAQEISARFAAAHPHLEPVLRELTDTLQRIGI